MHIFPLGTWALHNFTETGVQAPNPLPPVRGLLWLLEELGGHLYLEKGHVPVRLSLPGVGAAPLGWKDHCSRRLDIWRNSLSVVGDGQSNRVE